MRNNSVLFFVVVCGLLKKGYVLREGVFFLGDCER